MPSYDRFLDDDVGADTTNALFGIELSGRSLDEVVSLLRAPPPGREALPLFTLNVAHVASLRRDAAFRHAYRSAWLVTVDGAPIHLLARSRGQNPPRVAGSSLVARLLGSRVEGMRAFFVVSSDATADRLRARLVERGFATETLAFVVPPFGFERDEGFSRSLAAAIAAHGTTHLFMGVGAPKSEIWVVGRAGELGGCFALCVGAGLDYVAGTRRRAPAILQATGLEWAWRFAAEPRRLGRRYLFDAFAFLHIAVFGTLDLRRPEPLTSRPRTSQSSTAIEHESGRDDDRSPAGQP